MTAKEIELTPVERLDIREALYAHAVQIDQEADRLPRKLVRRKEMTRAWATRLRKLALRFDES